MENIISYAIDNSQLLKHSGQVGLGFGVCIRRFGKLLDVLRALIDPYAREYGLGNFRDRFCVPPERKGQRDK
jgi:hypothetical protein